MWLFDYEERLYRRCGLNKETKNVEDKTNGRVFVEFDARELKGLLDCIGLYGAALRDTLSQNYETARFRDLYNKIDVAHDEACKRVVSESNKEYNIEFHKFYKHEFEIMARLVKEELTKVQRRIAHTVDNDLINRACEEFYKKHLVALLNEDTALKDVLSLICQRITSILDCGDCNEALTYNGK